MKGISCSETLHLAAVFAASRAQRRVHVHHKMSSQRPGRDQAASAGEDTNEDGLGEGAQWWSWQRIEPADTIATPAGSPPHPGQIQPR